MQPIARLANEGDLPGEVDDRVLDLAGLRVDFGKARFVAFHRPLEQMDDPLQTFRRPALAFVGRAQTFEQFDRAPRLADLLAQRLDIGQFVRQPIDRIDDFPASVIGQAHAHGQAAEGRLHLGFDARVGREGGQFDGAFRFGALAQPREQARRDPPLGGGQMARFDPPGRRAVEQFRRDRVARPNAAHESQRLADVRQRAVVGRARRQAEIRAQCLERHRRAQIAEVELQDGFVGVVVEFEDRAGNREDLVHELEALGFVGRLRRALQTMFRGAFRVVDLPRLRHAIHPVARKSAPAE